MNKTNLISIFTLTLGLLGTQIVAAQSLAETAVNKSNEVIDAVLEAYGGATTIAALKSVSMSNVGKNSAVGQSRNPGAPFDRDRTTGTSYIDYENKIFLARTEGTGGGNEFDFGTVINGENSFNINFRAKFATPLAQPDFNTSSGPFIRITAPLLVKQLQERRHTSHWLGVEDVDGKPHDVITLVMEVGPGLSLYFDRDTHLLNRSERILPPFGVVGYRFRDHKKVDGIPFNNTFELLINGTNNLDRVNSNISVNKTAPINSAVPKGFRVDEPREPDLMSSNKLDEGVYLIGAGGAYSLFVEMDDYVFAAGATAGAASRIIELRKVIPKKPIRYALLTHHHNDHIPAAPDFVAAGATLLTVEANEAVVRAVAGDGKVQLEFIQGSRTFAGAKRTIEIRNIGPTPHAENMLVVYLPKEGIVFEADHFTVPLNGTLPTPGNNASAFAAAIGGWNFDRIVGAHSPLTATKADLERVAGDTVSAR